MASLRTRTQANESRRSSRKRILKGALIVFAARHSALPCVVRDLSDTGAHIVADVAAIPNQFTLIIELDGFEADCEIVWRKQKDAGLRFVSPPRTVAPKRAQVVKEMTTHPAPAPTLRRSSLAGAGPSVAAPSAAGPVQLPPAQPPLVKPKATFPILIAEDDPDDQEFLADAFHEIGFTDPLIFVNDGVELMDYLDAAGRHAGRSLPGLILLDLNMPRMDGRSALVAIKSAPAFRRIPVVVLSTSDAERDVRMTYDIGIASYIPKPSSAPELAEVARHLVNYWQFSVRLAAP